MAQPTPTVLLMEADAVVRASFQELLEDLADCREETTASGVMGSARADSGGIDLVLLDPRLPDLDGLNVCRRLCARAEAAALPIIVLSGAPTSTDRTAFLGAGASDYSRSRVTSTSWCTACGPSSLRGRAARGARDRNHTRTRPRSLRSVRRGT